MSTLIGDLRLAVRTLAKSPVFTLVALLCVTLGAGAVTTIVSGMNAVVLRPLPGTSGQDRLVGIDRRSPDLTEGAQASYRLYQAMRDHAGTFAGIAAWSKVDLSVAVDGRGHAVYGNIVSGNFFSVLGVRPALGRFFNSDEDIPGAGRPVVVVSYSFWKAHLAGNPSAAGRLVTVNGRPYTLIGVAPPEFRGAFTPLKIDAWVPLAMQPELRPGRNLADAAWLWTFGRLKPGVGRDAARQELSALFAAHAATAPELSAFRRYTAARLTWLTGLPEDARVAFLGFAGALLGAAFFVLLIASVNIASMLSARAIARRREMAVRAALGASRWRLARQVLTEVLLVFLLGGLGAVAFAVAATSLLERLPIPGDTPLMLELSPDWRVLAFALGLVTVTGLTFGLAPAWRAADANPAARLRGESAGAGHRRTLFGSALIVGSSPCRWCC
jgi:predicted permease